MYVLLKLRKPGWPPGGASGSPVSVLMPGHIAPEDEREQQRQGMKEEATASVSWQSEEIRCVSQDVDCVWKQREGGGVSSKAQLGL